MDIVVHRFEFLKKLKKKIRELIFKVILSMDEIPTYYKINIHEYLKFTQLFVSRDAEPNFLTMFMLTFLFKESREISFDGAMAVLDQIDGPVSKHSFVE